jgi:hypothetical protein
MGREMEKISLKFLIQMNGRDFSRDMEDLFLLWTKPHRRIV